MHALDYSLTENPMASSTNLKSDIFTLLFSNFAAQKNLVNHAVQILQR